MVCVCQYLTFRFRPRIFFSGDSTATTFRLMLVRLDFSCLTSDIHYDTHAGSEGRSHRALTKVCSPRRMSKD